MVKPEYTDTVYGNSEAGENTGSWKMAEKMELVGGDVPTPAAKPPKYFDARILLSPYQDKLTTKVAAKHLATKLRNEGLISEHVKFRLENTDPEEAQQILFADLVETGTPEKIRGVCSVMTSEVGYPAMNALGKSILEDQDLSLPTKPDKNITTPKYFDARILLTPYQDKLTTKVAAKHLATKLRNEGLTSEHVKFRLENTDPEEARQILFADLVDTGTPEKIRGVCSVMAREVGYPAMNALGKSILEDEGLSLPTQPDKNTTKQNLRPGVGVGDEQDAQDNVRFAIVTANDNEWESATFFMGTAMDKCKITEVLKEYLTKNFNFRELFETDGITVEFTGGMFQSYRYVRVCGVLGVLIQCTDTGSHGPGASEDTVTRLLKTARSQKWDLLAVFLIGCCGCTGQEKEGLLGAVLIAKQIVYYKVKLLEGDVKMKSHVEHTYNMNMEWVDPLIKPNKNKELSAPLQVQNVQCIPFLSGDFLVADEKFAEYQRTQINSSVLGIEMEGAGAHKANSDKDTALHDNKRAAILVVKGVSDFANSKKNADTADFAFFNKTYTQSSQLQEKDFPTDEDSRQQMCTMMSLMIVFRAIKAKIVGKWY